MVDVSPILDEIDAKMTEFALRVFSLSQQNLIDDGKVDTGGLLQTGNVSIGNYLHKTIVYPAIYADVVNSGRNPGTTPPPASALHDWVRRKLGVRDEKEVKQISYAISKSIGERGIAPTFFFDNAVNQAVGEFTR
jgi:hypothetical protein